MRVKSHPSFEPLPMPAILRVPATLRSETPWMRPIGTHVFAGERLTESASQLDHWPLAPVAGEIVGETNVTLTSGRLVKAVVLTPVAEQPEVAAQRPACTGTAPSDSDRGGWIDRLRDAGIWADRWASPNLLAQLHESLRRSVDTVVCSVLDGDPNLPIGAAMAVQETDNLIAGVRQIARIAKAARAIIVLQKRLLPGVAATVRRAGGGMAAIEIVNDYPQADPTILLATVLRRKLRPGRLPTEQGVVLLDAAAAVAVGRVVTSNTPMLTVPVAMFNHAHNSTVLAVAPVGASVDDLLAARKMPAGGFIFRGGDVLRNQRIPRVAVLAGGEIALHASPGPTPINPDPCIRCGWCVEACPSCIHPAGLLDASQRRDYIAAERYGLAACVECGLCDYVCPSRLPILNGIRMMRKEDEKC
jgi:electron transport complex protein RnfC